MRNNARAGVLAIALAMPGAAYAQKWVNTATLSPTAPLVSNSLCFSDGRDMACDSSAGLRVTSGTVAFSNVSATNISVSTINGAAVSSFGGAGASKLASLTDVDVSGKVSGSVLVYNAGTISWTALPIQSVMSTTTMTANFPDAIKCHDANNGNGAWILYLANPGWTDGDYYIVPYNGGASLGIGYTAAEAYVTSSE